MNHLPLPDARAPGTEQGEGSVAIGLAFHELVATAEVDEVAAHIDRARRRVPLDGYAMSCAMMFAQVCARAPFNPRTKLVNPPFCKPLRPRRSSPHPLSPSPAQPLLVPGAGFDCHAALAAGICLAAKVLYEDRVFTSDFAAAFAGVYSLAELIDLEAWAFALWLPNIAHIHDLALAFRTSLLDLMLDHHAPASWARAPTRNASKFSSSRRTSPCAPRTRPSPGQWRPTRPSSLRAAT